MARPKIGRVGWERAGVGWERAGAVSMVLVFCVMSYSERRDVLGQVVECTAAVAMLGMGRAGLGADWGGLRMAVFQEKKSTKLQASQMQMQSVTLHQARTCTYVYACKHACMHAGAHKRTHKRTHTCT